MIIYILRLIIFIISYVGLINFIKNKFKVKSEFSLATTTILIILILFISSILNLLKMVTYILFVFGLIYDIIYISKKIKNKQKFEMKLNYKIVIIIAFIAYLTILAFQFGLVSYDNYSHWALIVKQLFTYDALPSFEYNLVDFTTYPPASALFIYYLGAIVGKIETSMIIGQLYLTFIFITPLMIFFKDDKKVSNTVIFVILSLLILNCNIPVMDLMVDTLLGTIGIFSCCVAYYYRNDLKKSFVYLTLISSLFILVKNSGLLFIAFDVVLLFLVGLHNKNIKKTILYCIYLLLISLSFFILWQQHLKMVYPANTGITTKHSISIANFKRTISKNGIAQSKKVGIKYLSSFINLKDNYIYYYLAAINAFIISMMFISKKYKELLKTLIFVDCMYICYWLCLGVMYILSMPYDEAIRLASYGRYMMSCIIVFFGISGIITFELNSPKSKIYNIVFIFAMLVAIYTNPFSNYKYLYSGNDHKEVDRIKKITEQYPIDKYENERVYIYFDCDFKTYYYYLFQYNYFTRNINLECDTLDISSLENGTIVITPDSKKTLKEGKHVIKLSKNVFKIKN